MKPFIQELPRHYGRSPQDAELQRVLERMAARAEADKDFTLEQLFPSTASGWGLALWEEAYSLRREPGQTEKLRRARVLAKIKGTSPSTAEQLRAVAQAFAPWPAQVREFPRENRFEVWFSQAEGTLDRREALRGAINERKPAHLTWMLGEAFRPAVFRSRERTKIVRVQVRILLPNLWGAVLFNGRRRFDGAVCFDQRLPGMRPVQKEVWRLDGTAALNGQRKLNGEI